MNEKEKVIRENLSFFGGISVLYGILFSFCMYKSLFGVTFLIYAVSTIVVLVLFLNKVEIKIKKETKIYFAAIVLCGLSTCLTGSVPLQFFNWCCMIGLLICAMLKEFFDRPSWNIFSYVLKMIVLFFTTIGYSFLSLREIRKLRAIGVDKKKNKNLSFVVIGVAVALCTLFFILPLLISSDMIFKKIFDDFAGIFSFQKVVPNLWTAVGITLTAFIGCMMIYGFFYASCHVEPWKDEFTVNTEKKTFDSIIGISFTSVIGGIYLLYSAIQIFCLFLGEEGRLPEGITYSQYARSGFWQLAAVTFLNIILVMICVYIFEENKFLKMMLTFISGCTFIMIASAAYRMYLYVKMYHLTFLRLLVFWFLFILALIMSGVIVSIYKKEFSLVHYMILISVCGYLIFSFAQPDYWIARYNVAHMEEMHESDLYYLLHGLSIDAAPVIAGIDPASVSLIGENGSGGGENELRSKMYTYFQTISDNNQDIYFRKANFSKIRAKRTADLYRKEHAEDKALSEAYYGSELNR